MYFSLRSLPLHLQHYTKNKTSITRTSKDILVIEGDADLIQDDGDDDDEIDKGDDRNRKSIYLDVLERMDERGELRRMRYWESGLLAYGWEECELEDATQSTCV